MNDPMDLIMLTAGYGIFNNIDKVLTKEEFLLDLRVLGGVKWLYRHAEELQKLEVAVKTIGLHIEWKRREELTLH